MSFTPIEEKDDMIESEVVDPKNVSIEFSAKMIELADSGKIDVIDVLLEYCEKHNLEYDEICDMMTTKLKHRVREEAVSRNLMKKHKKLF